MSYVWYAGYGSNLHQQRFLCYIIGGSPQFGMTSAKGCTDKTMPVENKPITINYPLYFAIPRTGRGTSNWGPGGVAFIDPQVNGKARTHCRMWKITTAQYAEVRNQEGAWYDHEIPLGTESGSPIVTITNRSVIRNIISPSDAYVNTIARGLRETYHFSDDEIADYLLDKTGIKGTVQKNDMLRKIA